MIRAGRRGPGSSSVTTREYYTDLGYTGTAGPGYDMPGRYVTSSYTSGPRGYLGSSAVYPGSSATRYVDLGYDGVDGRSAYLRGDRASVLSGSSSSGYIGGEVYDRGSVGSLYPGGDSGMPYDGVDVGSSYLRGDSRYGIRDGSSGYIDTYSPLGVGSSGSGLRYGSDYPLGVTRGVGAVRGLGSEILRGGPGRTIGGLDAALGEGVGRRGPLGSGNGGDILSDRRDAGLGSLSTMRNALQRAAGNIRDIIWSS